MEAVSFACSTGTQTLQAPYKHAEALGREKKYHVFYFITAITICALVVAQPVRAQYLWLLSTHSLFRAVNHHHSDQLVAFL
jgi:hypothetical protein